MAHARCLSLGSPVLSFGQYLSLLSCMFMQGHNVRVALGSALAHD